TVDAVSAPRPPLRTLATRGRPRQDRPAPGSSLCPLSLRRKERVRMNRSALRCQLRRALHGKSRGASYLTQWGTQGTGDGQFGYMNDIAVDASGNVYVADAENGRVQTFTSAAAYL